MFANIFFLADAAAQGSFGDLALAAAALGAAIAVIGAAIGIGKIAATSVESMARQPEVKGDIRGAMILTAALIEGVALFAVAVCFLIQNGVLKQVARIIG